MQGRVQIQLCCKYFFIVLLCASLLPFGGKRTQSQCCAGAFLADVNGMFLVPYDSYLVDEYKAEKRTTRVITTSKEFKDWYKNKGGRW
jgi:hypothetical protein